MIGGGFDFGATKVSLEVTLGSDVSRFDDVEVDELDLSRTDGSELNGDLASDGTDADHGDS